MAKQTEDQKKANIDLENFRQKVVNEELTARYNKAIYEKMEYYIKARDISHTFLDAIEEDNKSQADQLEDLKEQIAPQVAEQNQTESNDN